jgi:hypothetical protein
MTISCRNKQKTINEKNNVEQENSDSIISPTLYRIIEDVNSFHDTTDYRMDSNILNVSFIKEKEDCFMIIYKDICYHTWLKYYTVANNKLIAIYDMDDECACDLIDINKLKKFNGISLELILDTIMDISKRKGKIEDIKKHIIEIDGFPNKATQTYDPIVRKYKIHSNDSLELVFTGFI